MRKTTLLKQLIEDPKILIMPGAYDALSAKLIEHAGFDACQITGFGLSAALYGKPDVGILCLKDQIDVTRNIVNAVNIPVMSDGDTGYGNGVNVYHTVEYIEATGAAGINLEDQVFPKKCGHMDNKNVISCEEMVLKIKAAVKAKKDKDFVINARTDSIAIYGVEEGVRRGNEFAKAGATIIFVEAPNTKEEIEYVIKNIKAPVSINMLGTTGGKTPIVTVKELEQMGAARVSFPILPVCSAAKAMLDNLIKLKQELSIESFQNNIMPFHEITNIVGLPFIKELEHEFSI